MKRHQAVLALLAAVALGGAQVAYAEGPTPTPTASADYPNATDPDGRPVGCPPEPASCAVEGFEYPPVAEPFHDPFGLNDDGRPVGCPDGPPALCAYTEPAPTPSPEVAPPTAQPEADRPGLPKAGL